jgi:hypothetical protein
MLSLVGAGGCQLFEDDERPSVRFPVTVTGEAHEVSFLFDERVHEIFVDECNDGCAWRDEYCSFDSALEFWRTGVGTAEPSGFDDARRTPPTLEGPVRYGVSPAGAHFMTAATPLREGAIYRIEADVYGLAHPDRAMRLHVDRYACAYFTVESSAVVALSE